MKSKVAYFGVFTAFALIASYIESLIPFYIGIPGVKLGLANIVILSSLYLMGTKESFWLSVSRIILSGFLFGNLYGILYSMAGGMLSLFVMALCKKSRSFSVIGVSIAGGVCHNIGQLSVAALVVENLSLVYYLPVLLIIGMVTGFLIGILGRELINRLLGRLKF